MSKKRNKLKVRESAKSSLILDRSEEEISYMNESPKFSLQHVSPKYCVSKCSPQEKSDFVNAMLKRKDLAWKKLMLMGKHALGYEKISHLNVDIPNVAKDKQLIAFRFSDKKPMVGFRERDVFYILWFDREFEVYKH